jgi:SAM-dependent methyltransferase
MSRREDFDKLATTVDFGKTARDYSRHRQGFPESFFARMAERGVGVAGQRLLDLGTGTGTLPRAFARRGCRVTGVDLSATMLAQAADLDREAGVAIEYVNARAEDTGLPDGAFDVVTAATAWHWFDGARASAEVRRVLVPGGTIVIASLDWVALPGNVVDATEALIEQHNPAWRLRGTQALFAAPSWLAALAQAGFEGLEVSTYDEALSYSHEDWRGRIRASAGVGATLPADAVARFDEELARLLARDFPGDPIAVPHRIFGITGRAPPIARPGR